MAERKTKAVEPIETEEVKPVKSVKAVEDNVEVNTQPEMVEIRLPRAARPDAPQEEFYSYNFKNYLIKRGQVVLVPKELADVINKQLEAEDAAIEFANSRVLRSPE